jgi:hypothetical protein
MPRRPLFCQICADLLDQLGKAAEAASAAGTRMTEAIGTKDFVSALQARTETRERYQETSERLRRHREMEHGIGHGIGRTGRR